MVDPVVDAEGNSYERSAIESWLDGHSVSPITRNAMAKSDLRPNRSLKDAIEEVIASGRNFTRKTQPRVHSDIPENYSPVPLRVTLTAKSIAEGSTDPLCPRSRKFVHKLLYVCCENVIHEEYLRSSI